MTIVRPAREHLASHIKALEQGWSPDTMPGEEAAKEYLASIQSDADLYLERHVDREAAGGPVVLPDGSTAPRLPGLRFWLWDGEFCGVHGFRWQPGTTDLPSYCLGHIGYSVVPWKRGRGYATAALRQLLPIVQEEGLPPRRDHHRRTDPAQALSPYGDHADADLAPPLRRLRVRLRTLSPERSVAPR